MDQLARKLQKVLESREKELNAKQKKMANRENTTETFSFIEKK